MLPVRRKTCAYFSSERLFTVPFAFNGVTRTVTVENRDSFGAVWTGASSGTVGESMRVVRAVENA